MDEGALLNVSSPINSQSRSHPLPRPSSSSLFDDSSFNDFLNRGLSTEESLKHFAQLFGNFFFFNRAVQERVKQARAIHVGAPKGRRRGDREPESGDSQRVEEEEILSIPDELIAVETAPAIAPVVPPSLDSFLPLPLLPGHCVWAAVRRFNGSRQRVSPQAQHYRRALRKHERMNEALGRFWSAGRLTRVAGDSSSSSSAAMAKGAFIDYHMAIQKALGRSFDESFASSLAAADFARLCTVARVVDGLDAAVAERTSALNALFEMVDAACLSCDLEDYIQLLNALFAHVTTIVKSGPRSPGSRAAQSSRVFLPVSQIAPLRVALKPMKTRNAKKSRPSDAKRSLLSPSSSFGVIPNLRSASPAADSADSPAPAFVPLNPSFYCLPPLVSSLMERKKLLVVKWSIVSEFIQGGLDLQQKKASDPPPQQRQEVAAIIVGFNGPSPEQPVAVPILKRYLLCQPALSAAFIRWQYVKALVFPGRFFSHASEAPRFLQIAARVRELLFKKAIEGRLLGQQRTNDKKKSAVRPGEQGDEAHTQADKEYTQTQTQAQALALSRVRAADGDGGDDKQRNANKANENNKETAHEEAADADKENEEDASASASENENESENETDTEEKAETDKDSGTDKETDDADADADTEPAVDRASSSSSPSSPISSSIPSVPDLVCSSSLLLTPCAADRSLIVTEFVHGQTRVSGVIKQQAFTRAQQLTQEEKTNIVNTLKHANTDNDQDNDNDNEQANLPHESPHTGDAPTLSQAQPIASPASFMPPAPVRSIVPVSSPKPAPSVSAILSGYHRKGRVGLAPINSPKPAAQTGGLFFIKGTSLSSPIAAPPVAAPIQCFAFPALPPAPLQPIKAGGFAQGRAQPPARKAAAGLYQIAAQQLAQERRLAHSISAPSLASPLARSLAPAPAPAAPAVVFPTSTVAASSSVAVAALSKRHSPARSLAHSRSQPPAFYSFVSSHPAAHSLSPSPSTAVASPLVNSYTPLSDPSAEDYLRLLKAKRAAEAKAAGAGKFRKPFGPVLY